MKILCVIPSRIKSTRLPRKPLLSIQGKPMIQWTYENAARSKMLNELVVATDSLEIADIIKKIGGKVALTDENISTGTERVAAVAAQYNDMDIIINLQGDEPFIKPQMLEQLVTPFFSDESTVMTTLAYTLAPEKYSSPGTVKVIVDKNSDALYFSRAPIPFYKNRYTAPVYNHMGLYAFRRNFLLIYKNLPETQLEKVESLEQLRVLEHGYKIKVCLTEEKTLEINTPEEYEQAQEFRYIP